MEKFVRKEKLRMFGFSKTGVYDYLVVGLGNPGTKYANTRHNIGFMVIDTITAELSCGKGKLKYKSEIFEGKVGKSKVLFAKPQTFMNNSGEAVRDIAKFYKIAPENIIVISDDVSLDVGVLRIRRKGSHGGHNGLKNIINLLGSENIPRIKVGVGKKPHPDYDLADFVLGRFPKEDLPKMQDAIKNCSKAVECIITDGVDKAMNMYNG